MNFTVRERYQLLNILPTQGDFRTIKTITGLRDDLLLSEQEVVDFNVVVDGERITWDVNSEKPKEVTIGPVATSVIVDALKALDTEKKLTVDYVPLYEKFINED